jgi:hypothetical protein
MIFTAKKAFSAGFRQAWQVAARLIEVAKSATLAKDLLDPIQSSGKYPALS